MTTPASPSNALYLLFRGELCAIKHLAVSGTWHCFPVHMLLFFYVRVGKVEEVHIDLVISLQTTPEKHFFFPGNNSTRKGQWLFWPIQAGHFIHIDNGKKGMQYPCWHWIIGEDVAWGDKRSIKQIQRQNHQNTLSNRALNRVLFPHSLS